MKHALGAFERFLHERASLPTLVHCALAHVQFETIHPFLDGNGRVGRLLITLLLCEREVLARPLLYLSYYFKAHRAQYYDRLTAVRNDDDWEGWIKFFLRGVHEVSLGATDTARAILQMREQHRERITSDASGAANGVRLLDHLCDQPILSVKIAARWLDCAFVTAASAIAELERLEILREVTGRQRNRRWRYSDYLDLFERQALRESDRLEPGSTPTTAS